MNIFTLAALIGAASFAHAQAPTPFVLKGTLAKVKGPTKVFLRREGLQEGAITDSAVVENGAFVLRGTTAGPTRARLVLAPNGKNRRLRTGQADNTVFYLEKGTIVFTSPDSLVNATATGSALSAQFQALKTLQAPTERRMQAVWNEYRAASVEQRQDPAFQKRQEAQEKAIRPDAKAVVLAYVKANSNSLVSLDAVKDIGGPVPNYAAISPLFNLLGSSVKATPDGRAYAATLGALQRVAIGAPAPDFTLFTPEGKSVSLASYRGKYVLVDFWGYGCGPCREENPNVVKIYNEYKGRNFDILSVTMDTETNRERWLKAIKDDNLTWTQVGDLKKGPENEAVQKYSVQAIPQNFLIDPSGKIVATNLRGTELKATVARFIP